MNQTVKKLLAKALLNALQELASSYRAERLATKDIASDLPTLQELETSLSVPKQPSHGDWATGIAMRLSKPWGMPPPVLAQRLVQCLVAPKAGPIHIRSAEPAGPGFVNIWLEPAILHAAIPYILKHPDDYGNTSEHGQARILLEFVSANPTGPLHVGHGRQAALGDCLANILESQGFNVTREFYYNDAGAQIENLALSVQARAQGLSPDAPGFPADGYRGDYIVDIAKAYMSGASVATADGLTVVGSGDTKDLDAIRLFSVAYLRHEQDQDLKAFGVRFDHFSLESALYRDGHVGSVVTRLKASGHAYAHEGALWLRSSQFGDDKDRVMQKRDGSYTYFVPDVAYHEQKFGRGFVRAINIQGSDHHGTIARVRAGLAALNCGIPPEFPDYVLHKMVTVLRAGQEVKISKRAGSYVTLRDLIDWSGEGDTQRGRDATRFFLVSRKADTEFVFDVDLALSRSDENPVYYVQYAHARACSILLQGSATLEDFTEGAKDDAERLNKQLSLLASPKEKSLSSRLSQFPEILSMASQELAPHLLAFYLRDLAADLHAFYNAERVLVDDPDLRSARLMLVAATALVIRRGLALLGVSAPARM